VYEPANGFAALIEAKQGAALTSAAYGTIISWYPMVLSLSIALFAFSTMIAWFYYGERAWIYLFGEKYALVYKLVYLLLAVVATVVSTDLMVDFSFMLMLAMALPNIFGLFILSGDVKRALDEYLIKLKNGTLDRETFWFKEQ
jgi:AGCS family alanine or glycine:cation symporter